MSEQLQLPFQLPFKHLKMVQCHIPTEMLFDEDSQLTHNGKWCVKNNIFPGDIPMIIMLHDDLGNDTWEAGCTQALTEIVMGAYKQGAHYIWFTWNHE